MKRITVNKKVVTFSLLALLLLIIGSTSYAYFTAVIEGNDTAKQTSVTTGTMSLKLDGTVDVNMDSAMPGTTVEMPFSVTNTGSIDTSYAIALTGIQNTFADKSDLVYIIEDKAGNIIKSQTVYPSPASVTDVVTLVPAMSIGSGEKQEYVMKVTFLEKNEPQNDNQGKIFSGKIQILSLEDSNYLVANVLKGQTIYKIDDYNYSLRITTKNKNVNIDTSQKTVGSSGICVTDSFDNFEKVNAPYYQMLDSTCNITNPEDYIGWYTFGYNDYVNGTELYKINAAEGTVITNVDYYVVDILGEGIIEENDDDGKSYIYRGKINNNYVSFAGLIWRIVRINGDGTIRLITEDSIGKSTYNEANGKASVGYTYNNSKMCTKADPCFNDTGSSSIIKTYLEDWYSTKLASYDNYISVSSYCNDTKEINESFSASKRIKAYTPSLLCEDTNNDFGGYYKLKVGLLNADELVYSGMGYYGNFEDIYLSKDYTWPTITPVADAYGTIFSDYYDLGTFDLMSVDSEAEIRPVINLKSDTIITSGDGTASNPYVVG